MEAGKEVVAQVDKSKEEVTAAFVRVEESAKAVRNAITTKDDKVINASVREFTRSLADLKKLEHLMTPEQKAKIAEYRAEFKKHLPFDPDTLADAAEREKWLDAQFPKIRDFVSEEFYSGAALNSDQLKSLRECLSRVHF